MNLTMKRYSCFWLAALLLATSCVDHRYDYMVDDSAYFAKSDLQEETLSVMNAQDYVYNVWIHKSGYYQEKFAARLELDYNYLVQYNSTNGTDFEMLDEKYYTFERDFVIEEGENEACVPLTIKTEQILTDMGYGTYYIPLSVNSLTPGKEVYLEKSHFILALTLQQPVLKIDGIGFEDSDGNYDGNVSIDANTFSGDTYELDITAMLDVQTTEELEVIYQDGEVTEDERKLDSQYYTYNQSVIMPIDKQYAENYLTVNIKEMPDGKWVIPVEISTSNDKIHVNQEKSWVKLTVIKGSLDDAIPCIGEYAQGNEIIISADQTLTNEIIASIEGREMSVSCVDNSTSEKPDWMSVSIVGSDVKLNVTNSNDTKRERVATITLTDNSNLLEKVITVRQCVEGYGTILNKSLWGGITIEGCTVYNEGAAKLEALYDNIWSDASNKKLFVQLKQSGSSENCVIIIDLGENHKQYNAVGLMPRLQWTQPSPGKITVEVSDDNLEWNKLINNIDYYKDSDLKPNGSYECYDGIIKWVNLGTQNSRYIKISMPYSSSFWSDKTFLSFDEIFVSNIDFD